MILSFQERIKISIIFKRKNYFMFFEKYGNQVNI